MDFKAFINRDFIQKALILALILGSFGAGFALAFVQSNQATVFSNNSTPKSGATQAIMVNAADGLDQSTSAKPGTKSSTTQATNCPIKAKPTAKGKKVYYYPGSLFYNKVKNPSCFDSEAAAQAAGYQRSAH